MDAASADTGYGKSHRNMSGEKRHFKQYRILTDLLNSGGEDYSYLPTVIPVSRINYKDLVFTLTRNSEQYIRPIVDLEKYGFIVKGNNTFFKAGKEAGLKSLICDVNTETLSDKHFSQFQLLEPIVTDSMFSVHAVLFMDILRRDISEKNLRDEIAYRSWLEGIQNMDLSIKFFPAKEAIEYKISKRGIQLYGNIYLKGLGREKTTGKIPYYGSDTNEKHTRDYNRENKRNELNSEPDNQKIRDENHLVVSLIHSAAKHYGKIRSINGVIP